MYYIIYIYIYIYIYVCIIYIYIYIYTYIQGIYIYTPHMKVPSTVAWVFLDGCRVTVQSSVWEPRPINPQGYHFASMVSRFCANTPSYIINQALLISHVLLIQSGYELSKNHFFLQHPETPKNWAWNASLSVRTWQNKPRQSWKNMLHVVSKIMRTHKCHVEYCRLCVSVFLGLMYKHDNLPYMIDLTEGLRVWYGSKPWHPCVKEPT